MWDSTGVQNFVVTPANHCGIVSDYPCGARDWGTVKPSTCLAAESDICIQVRYTRRTVTL